MRKEKLKRLITTGFICTSLFFILVGCGKEDIEYGSEIGTVSGVVEFNGDEEPVIKLDNIKSYVGDDIDYISYIDIQNIDEDDEVTTSVDASVVDIFSPGDYKAIYTVLYRDKEYTKEITVTIIERETSNSDSKQTENDNISSEVESQEDETTRYTDSSDDNNNNDSNDGNNNSTTDNKIDESYLETTKRDNNNSQSYDKETTKKSYDKETTKKSYEQITTKKNSEKKTTKASEKKTTKTNKETTRKQIVTSAGSNVTTEKKDLGYYNIELLSGKIVRIKGNTSKYIVSTRTDVSTTKIGNTKYKISKLVVTYSNGDTQVLETVQEKIK